MHSYRYVDTETEEPLLRCPACAGSLAEDGSINIELTDGSHTWKIPSRLEADGCLVDTTGQVAQGLHSATRCGHCGEMLINMPNVDEHDLSTR